MLKRAFFFQREKMPDGFQRFFPKREKMLPESLQSRLQGFEGDLRLIRRRIRNPI
jgi:hypothetical protein